MKLNEIQGKTLKEIQDALELVDYKIHTDNSGEIKSLEVKYVPSSEIEKQNEKTVVYRNR